MKNKIHRHGARSFLSCYPASLSIHFVSMADNNDQSYMLSSLHAKWEKICFSQFSFKSEKEVFQKPLLKVPHISLADCLFLDQSMAARLGFLRLFRPTTHADFSSPNCRAASSNREMEPILESEPKCPGSQTVTSQNYTFENLCN